MNLHRPVRAIPLSADARADAARIQQIWAECHERYGKLGPFLFEASAARTLCLPRWCIGFSPLPSRWPPTPGTTMDAMMSLPAFQEWTRAGLAETLVIERFETV